MNNTTNNTYNPWDAINPLFEEIFKCEKNNSALFKGVMKTDISEYEEKFLFKIEVPGIEKDNIKISLEDGNMIVSASLEKEEEEGMKSVLKERNYGTYKRSFYVGDKVRNEDLKAKCENGLLTITLMKRVEEPEKTSFINID